MSARRSPDEFRAEQNAKKQAKGATVGALNTERERAANQSELDRRVAEILRLGQRVITDIIGIGQHLVECKRLVGHGEWLPWLSREFAWSENTALHFMRVFEMSKTQSFANLHLPLSSLYLLAAPSTPESARHEVLERAKSGESVSVTETEQTIKRHKTANANEVSTVAEPDGGGGEHGHRQRDDHVDRDNHGNVDTPATSLPTVRRLAKRSILQLWEDGDTTDRQLIRDLVIEEYFAATTGADLFLRIPADRRRDVISELLDRLGAEGLRQIMSPELKCELQKRASVKGKSINLTPTSSTVSGDDAGNRGACDSKRLGNSNGQ